MYIVYQVSNRIIVCTWQTFCSHFKPVWLPFFCETKGEFQGI